MNPSAKKRPKNRVVFEMQDEEPQHKIEQAVSKVIKLNRLKMVLKNLSLLRLFNNSRPRVTKLYKLANRCWNSLLSVRTILLTSSGNTAVRDGVDQNNGEPQEVKCSKKKLESKKLESRGKPKESKPKVGVGKNEAQQSWAAVLEGDQVEPEIPRTSRGHGLTASPGAQERQLPTDHPRIIFLKTHQQRTALEGMEQLEAASREIWFEGLPTRIHLPGPRVMCRSSTLRILRRRCTRFCSASLPLPMYHRYRV